MLCARTVGDITYRTYGRDPGGGECPAGVEYQDDDVGDDLIGLRGVWRHMVFPSSLDAELRAIGTVRERFSDLMVISPFVTSVDQCVWFRKRVRAIVSDDVVVGTMVETPAAAIDVDDFTAAGCRRFVVGSNDLTSLLTARRRGSTIRQGLVLASTVSLQLTFVLLMWPGVQSTSPDT